MSVQNLIADGGHADEASGGVSMLGGFNGVNSGQLRGNGPGAPLYTSTNGHGAAYGGHGSGGAMIYGENDLSALIGGSSEVLQVMRVRVLEEV